LGLEPASLWSTLAPICQDQWRLEMRRSPSGLGLFSPMQSQVPVPVNISGLKSFGKTWKWPFKLTDSKLLFRNVVWLAQTFGTCKSNQAALHKATQLPSKVQTVPEADALVKKKKKKKTQIRKHQRVKDNSSSSRALILFPGAEVPQLCLYCDKGQGGICAILIIDWWSD